MGDAIPIDLVPTGIHEESAMETSPTQQTRLPRQSLLPPLQAVPVERGGGSGSGSTGTSAGVAAAGNACRDLTGLAQQMCYAAIYRI